MKEDYFADGVMEMPTPCQHCGGIFDLQDGTASEKWYPNTIICESCGDEEAKEIELDSEIEELTEQISDAQYTIKDSIARLIEIGKPAHELPGWKDVDEFAKQQGRVMLTDGVQVVFARWHKEATVVTEDEGITFLDCWLIHDANDPYHSTYWLEDKPLKWDYVPSLP